MEALRSGAIHLTGLYVLSSHVTDHNVDELLAGASGKSRREIERLIARVGPLDSNGHPLPQLAIAGGARTPAATPASSETHGTRAEPGSFSRIEPLSAAAFRITLTAGLELWNKIEEARELVSHRLPSGDLAVLFERALDELLQRERRRRRGTLTPRAVKHPSGGTAEPKVSEHNISEHNISEHNISEHYKREALSAAPDSAQGDGASHAPRARWAPDAGESVPLLQGA